MSKRGDPRRGPATPRTSPANAQSMLQSFQQQMLQAQESLATETVESSAGGGAVSVVVNGQQKVQSIKISPEVVVAGDVEMLQDLIIAAVNEAIDKSQQIASQKMGSLTGGLGLPGLLG